ncbi:MAG TPA: energy-coupling factor transporter transmembrane component T [Spirochaetia bacterium]|nr:energy-coupling factor transporter transmembrane component T [Spirochaetia bacterium]
MRRYDFGRLMDFAHYVPGTSPLHRMHPGAKLLLIAAGITLLVVVPGIAPLGLILAMIFLLVAIGRIPVSVPARTLLRALPWLLLVIVIQVLTVRGARWGAHYRVWGGATLRGGQLYLAAVSILRFTDLILFLALSIAVTEAGGLAYGVEALLSPLARIGIPARGFSLTITIALYFLPLFAMEGDRIMKSQASRGADFSQKGRGILGRVRAYFPLFVPLIVLALRHAENLARAMEARGFTPKSTRSRLVVHKLSAGSVAAAASGIALAAAAIVYPLPDIEHHIRSLF